MQQRTGPNPNGDALHWCIYPAHGDEPPRQRPRVTIDPCHLTPVEPALMYRKRRRDFRITVTVRRQDGWCFGGGGGGGGKAFGGCGWVDCGEQGVPRDALACFSFFFLSPVESFNPFLMMERIVFSLRGLGSFRGRVGSGERVA